MSKKLNVVTCEIRETDSGRFFINIEQTLESGKRVMSGLSTSSETHEGAVERATNQIKRFLMPVVYSDEPLDLEWEMPE